MGMLGVTAPLGEPVGALGVDPTKPPFGNAGLGEDPGMLLLPTLGATPLGGVP